jgi:hypothetical protein
MGRLPQKAETHPRQINNENYRRAATAVEPTTKSSLFEVPLNHSGTEGHYGLQCVDVPRSTWGAPSRIKRPTMKHIRFIRLKYFSDRL